MGFQVLMQADWEPIAVAPLPGGTSGAAVTLVRPTARLGRNLLSFGLRCNQAIPCVGAVVVQNRNARVANAAALRALGATDRKTAESAAKRSAVLTVARAAFKVAPGKTKTVRARFTRKGKRYIRKYRRKLKRAKLYANLTMGKQQIAAGRLKLRR
jgi:hypothetical protein